MTSANDNQKSLAIVGGGITGLSAAYFALKNGADPASITIYESTQRLGGKIQTGYLAGDKNRPVNMGAEFIDTEHTRLIAMCQELGVKLNESKDQGQEIFQKMDGSIMRGEEFHAQYGPLHERIRADKAEVLAHPDGPLAQRVNNMSLADYLTELRGATPIVAHPTFFQRIANFVTGASNLVSPEIATMAMQSFASEMGQPPQHINALQFLHEASAEAGSFLESDCAYRVDGGTENIIHALEKNLAERGVKFVKGATVQRVEKQGHGTHITFAGHEPVHADKLVLALPAYALAQVQGLESVGMDAVSRNLVATTQYTNSVKFTVRLKDGIPAPNSNFFANHGLQVWSSGAGELTFLVNADKLDKMTPRELVAYSMDSYARAQGATPHMLFDMAPGNIVFNNPGKNACYASPAPGQAQRLEHLAQHLDTMAQNGVAVAGTYLPLKIDNAISLGFMECGVASAERGISHLVPEPKERPKWLENTLSQGPALAHAQAAQAAQGTPVQAR